MIQIAICDDDIEVIETLNATIEDICKKHSLGIEIEKYSSSSELISEISNGNSYDLIFLDIQMPNYDGVSVGKYIREELDDNITQIVYISSETKYALELFKIRPLDFVIKPIKYEQIDRVMKLAGKLIATSKELFEYTNKDGSHRIEFSKILYFYSEARKIIIVTTSEKIEFYDNIDKIFDRVKIYNFIHIHKSYVVNESHIVQYKNNSVIMSDGIELPISRSKKAEVKALWVANRR